MKRWPHNGLLYTISYTSIYTMIQYTVQYNTIQYNTQLVQGLYNIYTKYNPLYGDTKEVERMKESRKGYKGSRRMKGSTIMFCSIRLR